MPDPIRDNLPGALLAAYDRSVARMTPTLLRLRFGNTAELAKLTPEAEALATAADGATAAWANIHRLHWASAGDSTATPGAQLVRSATFAKGELARVHATVDAAAAAAEARLEKLQATLQTALEPPASAGQAMLDSEARAMNRAAPDAASARTLAHQHQRAVATAPAGLSGLADEVHASVRASYLRAVAPDATAQYSDLRAAVDAAGDAWAELDRSARDMIDFATADRLTASAGNHQ